MSWFLRYVFRFLRLSWFLIVLGIQGVENSLLWLLFWLVLRLPRLNPLRFDRHLHLSDLSIFLRPQSRRILYLILVLLELPLVLLLLLLPQKLPLLLPLILFLELLLALKLLHGVADCAVFNKLILFIFGRHD